MRVEIWSDVVCPWCYLGTRRFDEAVAQVRAAGGDGVAVTHRAFQLDPGAPRQGPGPAGGPGPAPGGGRRAARRAALERAGHEVGIELRWEGMRPRNTFDAHRLAAWALDVAGPAGQGALHQRLFRAYFTDHLDIGDHRVLAALAAEVGLDAGPAAEVLATGGYAGAVRADEQRAGELDIHGVPTFVVEGRWVIPGAQDVDTFAALLARARRRLGPRAGGGAAGG